MDRSIMINRWIDGLMQGKPDRWIQMDMGSMDKQIFGRTDTHTNWLDRQWHTCNYIAFHIIIASERTAVSEYMNHNRHQGRDVLALAVAGSCRRRKWSGWPSQGIKDIKGKGSKNERDVPRPWFVIFWTKRSRQNPQSILGKRFEWPVASLLP